MKENYNDNINSFIIASFIQVLSVGNYRACTFPGDLCVFPYDF